MTDKMNTYPIITAEILNPNQVESANIVLFNSRTNRGYTVEGLAALLCKTFNGKKTLSDLILDLEREYELEPNIFSKDIAVFVNELENNGLVKFNSTPQG